MKLILKVDVENLGRSGDIVEVAEGYGRNYLVPRGIAVRASPRNVKELEHQKRLIRAEQDKAKQEAEDLAKRLGSLSCTIARKAGEEDRLFGSVTARDIADALKEEGVVLDRKKIHLEDPIKKTGVYSVEVRLHPEVVGQVKVWVVKE